MSSTCSKGFVSLLASLGGIAAHNFSSDVWEEISSAHNKRFLSSWLSGGSSKIDGWGEPFAEAVDQRSLIRWKLKEQWTQVSGFSLRPTPPLLVADP